MRRGRDPRAPISERPAGPPRHRRVYSRGGTMPYFVGLDWASQDHAVCVINEHGHAVRRGTVAHTHQGLSDLCAILSRLAEPAQLPIALERPSGLLVDTLVEAGFPVVPIHPNVMKACRSRYGAAPGKHAVCDAFILADMLRPYGHRFRPLRSLTDETRALRALVRTRDDLVAQRIALANQLRALLESFWPGAPTC